MRPTKALELAQLLGAKAVGIDENTTILDIVFDSREVKANDLFVAVLGVAIDGHTFVNHAFQAGASAVLVERPVSVPHLLVDNVVQALAKMAKAKRDEFSGPVVAITGSNGKTITKEFVASSLSPLGPVVSTPGNRNTEFTAPLLMLELEADTAALVVEMGMRGFGQIAHLASFTQPTIGIITNIGFSHLESVGNRAGIAKAKGELLEALPSDGVAILWQGDLFLDVLKLRAAGRRVVTFGFTEGANCQIHSYSAKSWRESEVRGSMDGQAWHCELPIVGRHIALNAAAAIAAAVVVGVPAAEAAASLQSASIPPMRMQVLEWNGATLVLDAYNASPNSVVAAIETMHEVATGRKLAVIGEMKELGESHEEGHRMVGRALTTYGVDQTVFLGEATEHAWNEMLANGASADRFQIAEGYEQVTEFLRGVQPGDTVLIKGSRAVQLEQALSPLLRPE
jgi:UDP-N-acetylmuramoyl-tripeptide--D-alanyl-D-alanine ligase